MEQRWITPTGTTFWFSNRKMNKMITVHCAEIRYLNIKFVRISYNENCIFRFILFITHFCFFLSLLDLSPIMFCFYFLKFLILSKDPSMDTEIHVFSKRTFSRSAGRCFSSNSENIRSTVPSNDHTHLNRIKVDCVFIWDLSVLVLVIKWYSFIKIAISWRICVLPRW